MYLTTITVPESISCVNTFHALWKNSKPAAFFQTHRIPGVPYAATVSTAKKVAQLLTTTKNFDYTGRRLLKTDFSHFPII